MTNQEFCYWLQGYFEIASEITLTKDKILSIHGSLRAINEPLGEFTQWLDDVVAFFAAQDYRQELITYFIPEIRDRLNLIFYHVIDNSYDTEISPEAAKKIHDGHGDHNDIEEEVFLSNY